MYYSDFDLSDYSSEEIKNSFAKSLKELRQYTNFTLKELENITSINNPSLSRYENGKVEPSLSQAIIITSVFILDIEDFIIYSIDGKCNFENKTIIERFNERIADFANVSNRERAIEILKEHFPHLDIDEILKDYK